MTTQEYMAWLLTLSLASTDITKTLGPRALGLAVALAASTAPGTTGSTYEYWLRCWRCPSLPGALVKAGWQWNSQGDGLTNPRGRLNLAGTGQEAIGAALQVTYGALGINGKIKASLTEAEVAQLCNAGGWPLEQPAPEPEVAPAPVVKVKAKAKAKPNQVAQPLEMVQEAFI